MKLGFTDHVEGPREQSSSAIYNEIEQQVKLADQLGVDYYWFSEHHSHVHYGHLPSPLLYALYLTGRTNQICTGTAIICLNLHNPISVAEDVAVADILSGNRLSIGFGSGSSPDEFGMFGRTVTGEEERHEDFREALRIIFEAWAGKVTARSGLFQTTEHSPLPPPNNDLKSRCWQAVNSVGSAQIAGELNLNMMYSHLRTPEQYEDYRKVYLQFGGTGLIAANRPIYVGKTDDAAWSEVEPAMRKLWRRFQVEGKISKDISESEDVRELAIHPINFIVGDAKSVARQILELYSYVPFDVLNAEARWDGLSAQKTLDTIDLLVNQVMPIVNSELNESDA